MATAAPSSTSVAQALQAAAQAGLGRQDSQWLLSQVLQRPGSWLLAHDDSALSTTEQHTFQTLLERYQAGEPFAYLLGQQGFYGLNLHLTPDVLIPRPDTETLVDWALSLIPTDPSEWLAKHQRPLHVLDLGTGSGAIALAIQSQRPWVLVTASDASQAALNVAMGNAQRLQLPLRFVHGHWFDPWADETFDLIVSNPPYIAEADPHMQALTHEPRSALTSGTDGLDDLRQIISKARKHLTPDGHLLLEHGYDQHEAVAQLLHQAGYEDIAHRQDLGGHTRCSGGRHKRGESPTMAGE